MFEIILRGIKNAIGYILDIQWHELPYKLLYLSIPIVFGYCTALIVFCFPLSIVEAITKRKLKDEIESKVVTVLATIFSIIFFIALFQ